MIKDQLRKLKSRIKDPVLDFVFDRLMKLGGPSGRRPFNFEELKLLYEALRSQNLCCIGGQMVAAFEKEFARTYGLPYAVASTSGTAAIHVALGALDLNPGDEVITAPVTDLGTIIPILYQNALPVFADIDETFNMDPEDVERKITPETRAIIAVHLFGNPCNMDAMLDVARRHKIPLIEDCSQAHVTEYRGRYVGTLADIGCFSFQQSKHMTTGDGGMTITSNKSYYERMKLFADKGYARKGWGARAYLFHAPNYRMTELVGAVGLAQLKKVKAVVQKRREMGQYMTECLAGIDGVFPVPTTEGGSPSYWLYPLRVEGADVNQVAERMIREKVWAMPGYTGKPIYLCTESLTAKKTYGTSQWPFTIRSRQRSYDYREGLCPKAERELSNLLCIPWDESWSRPDIERAAKTLAGAIEQPQRRPVTARSSAPTVVRAAAVANRNGHPGLRIGIVGCGQMGRWHLAAYRANPRCQIVSLADSDLAKAEQFAVETQGKAYASHLEMLQGERLDGISICTIPSTHRQVVVDALNSGVNVLCEKPLAISVEQADEMVRVAHSKSLLALPAFKFRFFEEVARTKELIQSGGLGKILTFRLMFGGLIDMSGTWYAQSEISGGGVIMDNGCHAVDLVRYLFGEIVSVSARASNHQSLQVEDTATLTVVVQQDAVGSIDLSWSLPIPSLTYLEIYGENGAAFLDFNGLSYRFNTWSEWKRIPNQGNAKDSFSRQINHFLDSITTRRPSILENGDGLKAQSVVEAAYRSLEHDKKIYLTERQPEYAPVELR